MKTLSLKRVYQKPTGDFRGQARDLFRADAKESSFMWMREPHHCSSKKQVHTNIETITCPWSINNSFIWCWKHGNNLNLWLEIILRSMQQQQHICIRCATLFTRILQTMNYHFKADQVRVISCPHMKTGENFVWQSYFILYLQKCFCVVAKVWH